MAFLSNGGYATWVQTIVVVSSVVIAYWTLHDTDVIEGKQTTIELARKYYSEQPAPAMALLRLTNAQLDVVSKARASITSYDPNSDPDNENLFKVARPLLKARIDGDPSLKADFEAMRDVYYEIATCIDTKACDQSFAGTMFGPTILRFYNDTCPYIEEVSTELMHANDNVKMLTFLRTAAQYTDRRLYLCRD